MFCTLSCVGHLRCDNEQSDYLYCVHHSCAVNETEWDGATYYPFIVRGPPTKQSIVVSKIYNVPLYCMDAYGAKVYYILGKENQSSACIHLENHDHSTKMGACRESKDMIKGLLKDMVERTPSATNSAIV